MDSSRLHSKYRNKTVPLHLVTWIELHTYDTMIYASISEMLSAERAPDLPVVVPTYNNPSYLRMMVDQLVQCRLPNIIIIDNNSTIEGMDRLLLNLSNRHIVVKKKTNDGPREFYCNKEFYGWLPNWFFVTDPDIGFNKNLPENFTNIMKNVSEKFDVFKVAFALDIEMKNTDHIMHEIKKSNTNGMTMHQWESGFWNNLVGETAHGDKIYRAITDTTFCLVNKSKDKGDILGPSARIAGRFTAQHFPWYRNQPVPIEEQEYYLSSIPSHWSETGNSVKSKSISSWAGGGFDYLGAFTQQNPDIIGALSDFFSEKKFDLVIEVGSGAGGFSMILKDECDKIGAKFVTYEIKEGARQNLNQNPEFFRRKIEVRNSDALASSELESLKKEIKAYGRTLVLCDGGNNAKEFCLIASLIKEKDVIMAHDYAHDVKTFSEKIYNKTWNWHEIKNRDVIQCMKRNGLEEVHPTFKDLAWLCCERTKYMPKSEINLPMEVNFIVTCTNKEEYWPFLEDILKGYKSIKAHHVLVYNGTEDGFGDVKIPNRGHNMGDIESTIAGYEAFKNNGCDRFIKLSVDSWLLDEGVIVDIFDRMRDSEYAGIYWDGADTLSTDVFFARSNLFERLKIAKRPGIRYEELMREIVDEPCLVWERHPVHWGNRWTCEQLKWTMEHDLSKNIINKARWNNNSNKI